jgi:hypothetical protein
MFIISIDQLPGTENASVAVNGDATTAAITLVFPSTVDLLDLLIVTPLISLFFSVSESALIRGFKQSCYSCALGRGDPPPRLHVIVLGLSGCG